MNGHPVRRGFISVAVYIALFLGIIVLQFSRQSAFNISIGTLALSGNYADAASLPSVAADAKAVTGSVSLFFRGMEFRLSESDGLASAPADVSSDMSKLEADKPVAIKEADDGATAYLRSGAEISFSLQYLNGVESLVIQAKLTAGQTELRVPYKPTRSARVVELDDGRSGIVYADEPYAFVPNAVDDTTRLLIFRPQAPLVVYGKVPSLKRVSPLDLVSPIAANDESYSQALSVWRRSAYARWERAMAGTPNEETIVAYVAEALARNNYRSAVASAPRSFVDGVDRGYISAPYFGRLDIGAKTLIASEREALSRLSRLANERDISLFAEPNMVAFIAERASKTLNDDVDSFARALDPSSITPALAVGLMEGYIDWRNGAAANNPYERLIDHAFFVIGETLRSSPSGLVFPTSGDRVDTASALRLGRALERAASVQRENVWRNLGRTILWSALQKADEDGSLPAAFVFTEGQEPEPSGSSRLSAARVYSTLSGRNTLPHSVPLAPEPGAGLWAWTCSPSVSLQESGNSIDIAVSFGIGDTHYMILRGIKPFKKIQLYGIDYRTDPRFERYDSSGWAYTADDRTLLLKMKHRSEIEHIKIFY